MKSWISAILAGLVVAQARPASADDETMPIRDLRLPLERYEDGKIKTQLMAGQANVPSQGEIRAKKVRVEFYKDEKVDALMVTDECRYDRNDEIARSASSVRIERGGIVITGTGFEFSMKDQIVKILSRVKVVFDHPVKNKEKGKGNGE